MLQVLTILIFSLLTVVSGFNLNPTSNGCLIQGEQCNSNCSAVIYCTGVGGTEITLDNCESKGESCATIHGEIKCSKSETDCPNLSGEPFKCLQSGPFPDPLDCQSSYICLSNDPNPAIKCSCERGYFWDSSYNQCSNEPKGVESCCISSESRPNCQEKFDGNFGPNCHPGYYYICQLNPDGRYQVYTLRCEAGMVYNPTSHTCERLDDSQFHPFGLKENEERNHVGVKSDAQCSVISTTTSLPTDTTEKTTVTICETMAEVTSPYTTARTTDWILSSSTHRNFELVFEENSNRVLRTTSLAGALETDCPRIDCTECPPSAVGVNSQIDKDVKEFINSTTEAPSDCFPVDCSVCPTHGTTTGSPTETASEPSTKETTYLPTDSLTNSPTDPPTDSPTDLPINPPTDPPTDPPTVEPTNPPTYPPTHSPTDPTDSPSDPPTDSPTEQTTYSPIDTTTETTTWPSTVWTASPTNTQTTTKCFKIYV